MGRSAHRRVAVVAATVVVAGLLVLPGVAFASAPGPLAVLADNPIQNTSGTDPVASASGPAAGDVLVGGAVPVGANIVNRVEAVGGDTGLLDAGVGSGGVLPLPSAVTSDSSFVEALAFAGDTIYATFLNPGAETMYVVSWNAQGQLNNGFGSGGLVTITAPSMDGFGLNGGQMVLVAGKLIVDQVLQGVGLNGVTLYAINPSTGTFTSLSSQPPTGFFLQELNAMQEGPDGNLYIAGKAQTSSTPEIYYGSFDPSTLALISQNAIADGPDAFAQALSFLGNTAYIGVNDFTGSVSSTQLWTAAAGSTNATQGQTIPTQIPGDTQTFTSQGGLIPDLDDNTLMDTSVVDTNSSETAASLFVMQTDGNTFGQAAELAEPDIIGATVSPSPGAFVAGDEGSSNGGNQETFIDHIGTPTAGGCSVSLKYGGALQGKAGQAYEGASQTLPEGFYSYALSSGVLPPGLTLDPSTGTISGTPTAPGTYTFQLTATDTVDPACKGSDQATITISPASAPAKPNLAAFQSLFELDSSMSSVLFLATQGVKGEKLAELISGLVQKKQAFFDQYFTNVETYGLPATVSYHYLDCADSFLAAAMVKAHAASFEKRPALRAVLLKSMSSSATLARNCIDDLVTRLRQTGQAPGELISHLSDLTGEIAPLEHANRIDEFIATLIKQIIDKKEALVQTYFTQSPFGERTGSTFDDLIRIDTLLATARQGAIEDTATIKYLDAAMIAKQNLEQTLYRAS